MLKYPLWAEKMAKIVLRADSAFYAALHAPKLHIYVFAPSFSSNHCNYQNTSTQTLTKDSCGGLSSSRLLTVLKSRRKALATSFAPCTYPNPRQPSASQKSQITIYCYWQASMPHSISVHLFSEQVNLLFLPVSSTPKGRFTQNFWQMNILIHPHFHLK